jgi:hypothetical protein
MPLHHTLGSRRVYDADYFGRWSILDHGQFCPMVSFGQGEWEGWANDGPSGPTVRG